MQRLCLSASLLVTASLTMIVCIPQSQADEGHWQLVDQARAALQEQARERFPEARIEISINAPDSRLTLPDCENLLIDSRGQQQHGRISVNVRCRQPLWSVFLPARVSVFLPVLVAAAPLARDTLLTAAHLTTREAELSQLRQMYLENADDAIGRQLTRPVAAGSVLYLNQLREPLLVRRGERVTILAERGGVRIATPGESLEDGRLGDQIRVRNRRSEKIIEAWISEAGQVNVYRRPNT